MPWNGSGSVDCEKAVLASAILGPAIHQQQEVAVPTRLAAAAKLAASKWQSQFVARSHHDELVIHGCW